MALSKKPRKSASSESFSFFCCKTRVSKVCVCIGCGKTYHNSCVKRDWAESVKTIDESRLICENCESEFLTSQKTIFDDINECTLLKIIIKEMLEKSNILMQQNGLMQEMLSEKEEKLKNIPEKETNNIPAPERADLATMLSGPTSPSEVEILIDGNLKISTTPTDVTTEKAADSNTEIPKTEKQKGSRSKKKASESDVIAVNVNCQENDSEQKQVPAESGKKHPPQLISTRTSMKVQNNMGETTSQGPTDKENPWEQQKKRGFNRNFRPTPIRGNREDTANLRVARRDDACSWLFLSGLSADTLSKDVENYLLNNAINRSSCEKLHTKNQNIWASFKICVSSEHEAQVMNAEFWPKGLLINRFLNLRKLAPLKG